MAMRQLVEFLRGAIAFAKDDGADSVDGPQAQRGLAFHRWIVRISGGFGVLGLLSGIFLWVPELTREVQGKEQDREITAYVAAPLMIAIAGILFGFALTCLFAPSSSFLSPVGRRLLKIAGTDSVLLARVVCLVVAILSGALLIGPLVILMARR
jgi:hypothetical protein